MKPITVKGAIMEKMPGIVMVKMLRGLANQSKQPLNGWGNILIWTNQPILN